MKRGCIVAVVIVVIAVIVAIVLFRQEDGCQVRRRDKSVWAGPGLPPPLLQDDKWHDLDSGDHVVTNEDGEACLEVSGCMLIYLFQNGEEIAKSGCPKSDRSGGNVTCAIEGTSVFNNSCTEHVVIETRSAELVLEGTWGSVTYLQEWQLSLILVSEGRVSVRPMLDFGDRTLGSATAVTQEEFLFTAPDDVLHEIGDIAGFRAREVYPFDELPSFIEGLKQMIKEPDLLESWMGKVREQALSDGYPPPPEVTTTVEVVVTLTRPNVLHLNFGPGDVPTLDPALTTDTSSVQVVDELTVGLTRLNEVTLELEPGMAKSWEISDDGLTYVFHLREGIPWVRWNGTEVGEMLDCDGNVCYVTAHDFEYGIKRTGIPDTASDYAYVLGFAIAGLDELNAAEGWADMTGQEKQALIDGVAVRALDDYTLKVTFTTPAVYNANIIGMWVAHAQPRWIIEGDKCTAAQGDRWSEPGINQSYGPYALKEWIHDSSLTIVQNPFWPGFDSVPVPQIDEIQWLMLESSAAFAEYEAGNLDVSAVPIADLDRVRADPELSQELNIAPYGCTYYYGFNTSRPPVDNVHMRRALSHAIDRQGLVDNVTKGGQQPAQWFCRPGMAACPTMESHPDAGIMADPDAAKAELQAYMDEAGYTSVDEIPEIILMHNTSEGHERIAEAIAEMWKETLGIQATITNQEWKVYLKTLQTEGAAPQVWRLGWCLDYPDANNWTKEVFAIGGHEETPTSWRNEYFTALCDEAAVEPDLTKRQDMYAEAETILCYEDAAIAPIYWYTRVSVTRPWVNRTYSQHGHEALEKWSLE